MEGRQKDYLEGAILAVDAVGYSRLMGRDEEATLRRLHNYRGLIQSLATTHDGRVFGVAGDSEMAIFAEAGDAVRCALEIQDAIAERDALLPKDSHMPVRIGINYGLVIVEDDSFFGDDVNVAARIESFAEAGEVCIAYNPVEETQALRPRESLAPVMPDAELEAHTENPGDGTWTGNNGIWKVELTVADGKFLLDASCEGRRAIRESVSGKVDETGHISANLFRSIVRPDKRPAPPPPIRVFGTPDALDFKGGGRVCRGGTLKLERVRRKPSPTISTPRASPPARPALDRRDCGKIPRQAGRQALSFEIESGVHGETEGQS